MNLTPLQQLNRVMLLACAPFFGMLVWLFAIEFHVTLPPSPAPVPTQSVALTGKEALAAGLERSIEDGHAIKATLEKYADSYNKTAAGTAGMAKTAAAQAQRPDHIFDARVSRVFGNPVRQTHTAAIDALLYTFRDSRFTGYALKLRLKSDGAMGMELGGGKLGFGETTMAAANRTGAFAGVNAGGFVDDGNKRLPLGTTIVKGQYVNGFQPSDKNLSFAGLSRERKLIGGKFSRQDELDKLNPAFGASFVPALLKDGKKLAIPSPWDSSPFRAPRTAVGNFRNDQLLFFVTDGYDERGSSGATLAEVQDLLQRTGVRDAYNLDGGGSSSLIYDGKVINRPSDGDRLRALATNFLFYK